MVTAHKLIQMAGRCDVTQRVINKHFAQLLKATKTLKGYPEERKEVGLILVKASLKPCQIAKVRCLADI